MTAVVLTGLAVLVAAGLRAQEATRSPDSVWELVDERSITRTGERVTVPRAYRTVRLDRQALDAVLAQAPMEFSGTRAGDVVLSLPMPDGTFARFRIEEAPMLEPALAAQFPEIRTYRGQGIDDPTLTTRFGWTEDGFHAIILGPDASVYVDPYARGDLTNYITYAKQDAVSSDPAPFCQVNSAVQGTTPQTRALPISLGTQLRTYRLAVAGNVEYTTAAGGTVGAALARMVTTMNRVNGIYERNLAMRMTLVGNNNLLIFTAEPDGYTNGNSAQMFAANKAIIDGLIGVGAYDIGHVFGTAGGGLAGPAPCDDASKANGMTGIGTPTGDVFDVDFVAHEMGHQFAANHSFNGSASSCVNRNAATAYEPGSGSTIMAYANICGVENLQTSSNDYFHIESLNEMTTFLAGTGGTCGTVTATGNTVPTLNAGADYTIPMGTPFELTATGNDGNGDTLTYGWEEYDLGAATAAPPYTDTGNQPLFRSYTPTTSATRTFPSLTYILNNANTPPSTYACGAVNPCVTGEVLPTTTRTMNFRVTARDNRAGGGGVVSDLMTVAVQATSGPFVMTSQNVARPAPVFGEGGTDGSGSGDPFATRLAYVGGSAQTVTWNVAGTTAAPVDAANVKILLSTDGGATFPTTLVASTPNDGSASVVLPNTATTTARLKVQAVGNIFFDISNVNFTITAAVVPWTDDPLVGGATVVRAVHLQEMRDRINALRETRMLAAFPFTDPVLTTGTTVVSATHLNQAREALNAVYTADSQPLPTYTNTITAGSTILAIDIKEIRDAIVARGG